MSSSDGDIPGGAISNRPLRFYFVADVSGSMHGDKIGSLNYAVSEALPAMRAVASQNAHVAVEVRALQFGTGFKWLTPGPVALEKYSWTPLTSGGVTDMGAAMRELAKELNVSNMPDRSVPPVIVLLTDGHPTDDFNSGLEELFKQPWARRAVRLGIGIGGDADLGALNDFIDHVEIAPLVAKNSKQLTDYISWASTAVLQEASAPSSSSADTSDEVEVAQDLVANMGTPETDGGNSAIVW